ncbi:cytochrome c oxidase, subunit VA/VI [Phlyctochytrium arcticum]|nr:cytochrome c oxidase, subunit VA/VI [Phlyctochytrium arcticum]
MNVARVFAKQASRRSFALCSPARIVAAPVFRRNLAGPAHHSNLDSTVANYPTAHDLDPSNKSDYEKYVTHWRSHFQSVEDDFELERGLNHIFATDWVPSTDVIADALKAARKLNTFATAVRIMEALDGKCHSADQYSKYMDSLKPLLEELGVGELKALGDFDFVREKKWHMQ